MRRERVPQPSLVGHYAGPISRLAAFAVDVAVSALLLAGILRVVVALGDLVLSADVDTADANPVVGSAILVVWLFLYYVLSWSLAGKTVGMALLGLRVVRRDGAALDKWHAFLRTIAFPLSFIPFGLGFAGIVVGREHRALHDVIAGTTVVYDWDARAARLRILAAGATAKLVQVEPAEPAAERRPRSSSSDAR